MKMTKELQLPKYIKHQKSFWRTVVFACMIVCAVIYSSLWGTEASVDTPKKFGRRQILEDGGIVANCDDARGVDVNGFINYFEIRYCVFDGDRAPLFILCGLAWLLVLFYLLSSTAESYFCPSLTEISRILKLTPNVAGVTFLALGNGAPDISAILIGVVISKNADIGIGAPTGGGVFVTTVVMGLIILSCEVKLTRRPFLRDVGMYLFAVVMVFWIAMDGKVHIWEATLFIVYYLAYVFVVIVGRLIYRKWKQEKQAASLDSTLVEATAMFSNSARGGYTQYTTFTNHLESSNMDDDFLGGGGGGNFGMNGNESFEDADRMVRAGPHVSASSNSRETYIPKIGFINNQDFTTHSVHSGNLRRNRHQYQALGGRQGGQPLILDYFHHMNSGPQPMDMDGDQVDEIYRPKSCFDKLLDSMEWYDKTWKERIQFVLCSPFVLARNLTIPTSDPKDWSRPWSVSATIGGPLFALFALQLFDAKLGGEFPLWLLVLLVCTGFAILVHFTSKLNIAPVYNVVFVVMAFVMSIVWIYVIANELVDMLQVLGVLLGLSDSILTLTVLAWGNSIGDMVSNIIVAKQGFPSMAVGAIFGSPMMNLLIGLGVSFIAQAASTYPQPYQLDVSNSVVLAFAFLVSALLMSLILVPLSNFEPKKPVGFALMGLYSLFITLQILVESGIILKDPILKK